MLIEANGLTVYRGDDALFSDLSFALHAGEIVRLEGSNGSGKTTLLRILCGLAEADEGELKWGGKPLRRAMESLREQILFIGHKPGINSELTPLENLQLLAKLETRCSTQNIEAALTQLLPPGRLDLPCRVLSAGQKRRVALARLLLTPAKVWMLDEPLTALDATGRGWLEEQLVKHALKGGSAVVTSHQPLAESSGVARTFRLVQR